MSNNDLDTLGHELSAVEIDTVSGGLASLGLSFEGQSILEVMSHWKEGLLVEQVSSYQSVSSGKFSIGLDI